MSRPETASIGTARMLEDGTVVLDLIAENGAGARGIGQLRYERAHPNYAEILAHLGGLAPGETKPVPPWS